MAHSLRTVVTFVAILTFFELSISIFGAGFAAPTEVRKINFDWRRIVENFSLGEFSLKYSLSEFLFLAVIRSSVLVGATMALWWNRADAKRRIGARSDVTLIAALFMFSLTLCKLLLLSEDRSNLKSPSVWILLSWNILAEVLFFACWIGLLAGVSCPSSTSKVSEEVEVEENGDIVSSDDRSRLISATADAAESNDIAQRQRSPQSTSGEIDIRIETGERGEKENKEAPLSATKSATLVMRICQMALVSWRWFTAGLIFLAFYAMARVFIPYYSGNVISIVVTTHSYHRLLHAVGILTLLSLASAVFAGLRGSCFMYGDQKFLCHVRKELFKSLVHQEIGFFDENTTGSIMSRLTTDCQSMSDNFTLCVNVFLRNCVMLIGSIVVMLNLSWRLTTVTFITIPFLVAVSKIYGHHFEKLSKDVQDALAKTNEVSEEVFSSMRTVRSFANETAERKRYNLGIVDVLKVVAKKSFLYMGFMCFQELSNLMILVVVLWYGGYEVIVGRMESTMLISFLLYQMQLAEAVTWMANAFTGLMSGVGASRKVFEYIDRAPKLKNDGVLFPDPVEGRIDFTNVCFSYPSRSTIQVLKDLSFSVSPGETAALVGPSGGGKSSCISLLEHFYEPTSGAVLVDGHPVSQIDHKFLHRMLALVGQEPVLYARSVKENISYAMEEEEYTDELIVNSAKMANAHSFIKDLPKGYDTETGEKGLKMSGGQKQRIAIARALVRQPKILLLDEATSALDADSEHLVQEALYKNFEGHTVLLIAHRLSTVEKADKIIVIDKGQVVQQGKHRDLLHQEGLYKDLVRRQLIGAGTEVDIDN